MTDGATQRVFFALWPDADTRRELAAWADRVHAACGGTPTRPDNLHLTLAFVGDATPDQMDALRRAAAGVAPRRFELVLDQPGYWKHNRIAWAGATSVPEGLSELASGLRARLAASHLPFDAKAFVPHVTLVRKASAPGVWPEFGPVRWTAAGFALVKSTPSPQGVRYVVDAAWP